MPVRTKICDILNKRIEGLILVNKVEILNDISNERLESYRISPANSIEDLVKIYLYNIKLSEALYPALALLEVTLRNHLNNAIGKHLKADWLISEVKNRTILLPNEYEILTSAYDKLSRPVYNKDGIAITKPVNASKLIAELTFGFWVNLCNDKYNPNIWMKKPIIFDDIFPYFDDFMFKKNPVSKRHKRINKVSSKLKPILKLRNRVFHHEPVFNHPRGLNNCYADIEELLLYMSMEASQNLIEISRFQEIWNKSPIKAKT